MCLKLREELTESHKQREEYISNCSAKLGDDIACMRAEYEGGNKEVRSALKDKTGKVSFIRLDLLSNFPLLGVHQKLIKDIILESIFGGIHRVYIDINFSGHSNKRYIKMGPASNSTPLHITILIPL